MHARLVVIMILKNKSLLLILLVISVIFLVKFFYSAKHITVLSLVTTRDASTRICWNENSCGWIQTPTVLELNKYPENPASIPSVVSATVTPQDIATKEVLLEYDSVESESFSVLNGGVIGNNYIVLALKSAAPNEKTRIMVIDRKSKVVTTLYTSVENYAYPLSLSPDETHILIGEATASGFIYEIFKLDGSNRSAKMKLTDFEWSESGYTAKPAWQCEKPEIIPSYVCQNYTNITNCPANTTESTFYTLIEKQPDAFVTEWFALNIPDEFAFSSSDSMGNNAFVSDDGKFQLMLNNTTCSDDYGVGLGFSNSEFKSLYINKYIQQKSNTGYLLSLAVSKFTPSEGAIEIGRAEVKKGNRSVQLHLSINSEYTADTITEKDISDKVQSFKTMLENLTIKY
jgi:hypothetical protein